MAILYTINILYILYLLYTLGAQYKQNDSFVVFTFHLSLNTNKQTQVSRSQIITHYRYLCQNVEEKSVHFYLST